jgi:hypothetical protein
MNFETRDRSGQLVPELPQPQSTRSASQGLRHLGIGRQLPQMRFDQPPRLTRHRAYSAGAAAASGRSLPIFGSGAVPLVLGAMWAERSRQRRAAHIHAAFMPVDAAPSRELSSTSAAALCFLLL